MLILWATQYKMPGEGPELLARAIALRLRARSEANTENEANLGSEVQEIRVDSITGIGDLPVLEVTEAARHKQASLLVISTQGRRGVARLLHPSFTEALVRESSIPVLVIGPRCRKIRELGDSPTQMFRAEFSRGDDERFRTVVNQSKALGFGLGLYHSVRRPIEPWLQTGSYLFSGAAPELHPYTSHEWVRATRHGQAWARWAQNQGVACTWELDDAPGTSNDHLIERARRLHAAAIWVRRRVGMEGFPVAAEEARDLVRNAPCPVGFLP
jgi:nucleotide-binding universal stress UspA family protein